MGRVRLAATAAAVAALVALGEGALAGPAAAADVSRAEAAELAARAPSDPAALAELEQVTSIDGRPADPGAALAGADPGERDERLAALERALAGAERGDADADAARARAEDIVGGFPEEPRESSGGGSSGGISVDIGALWVPLAILAALGGALVALRFVRNREAAARVGAEEEGGPREASGGELARRAAEAEKRGAFEEALRLRYAIALRTLQESGRVPAAPSVTPALVSRRLGDARADRLVRTFERVVYGGRRAAAEDAHEARDGWPAVIGSGGSGSGGEAA